MALFLSANSPILSIFATFSHLREKKWPKSLVVCPKLLTFGLPNTSIFMVKNACQFIYRLYADGFRQMTWGRTLWILILLKLCVIFLVLKLFFFPDFLKSHARGDESQFVSRELIEQAITPDTTPSADPN